MFDYLAHYDSPVRGLFANPTAWALGTRLGFSFSSAFSRSTNDRPYYDILFHINEKTAEHLHRLFDELQIYIERNKDTKFSTGHYYWAKDKKSFEMQQYLRVIE